MTADSKARWDLVETPSRFSSVIEHDLFGKPLHTFPEHALTRDPLNRDRGGFAAADAERGHAALEVLRLQRVQQRHDQPRAGGADGVAKRAGAAVDVQFLPWNTEVLLSGHRHHRKG